MVGQKLGESPAFVVPSFVQNWVECLMHMALVLLLITAPTLVQAGSKPNSVNVQKATERSYKNVDLGFTYMRPSGLIDFTAQAKVTPATNHPDKQLQFETVLEMISGTDDQAADWAAISIETYPRGRDKDKEDDVTAGLITNNARGGGKTTKREVIRIAGHDFSVSYFERQDPPLTRFAIACTTVRKEKFLSFFLTGNSYETVQRLMKSMDTVKFQPPN